MNNENENQCPICRRELIAGAKFCPHCGARVRVEEEENPVVLDLVEQYQRRVSQEPDDANAHYNLALAHFQARQFGAAIQELHKVRQLDPDFLDALYLLVLAHRKLGDLAQANSALDELRRLASDHPKTLKATRLLRRGL